MKKLPDYELEDLLTTPSFKNWVFQTGYLNSEAYWTQWQAEDPARAVTITQARAILLATQVNENEVPDERIEAIVANTRSAIASEKVQVVPLYRRRTTWWWAAAAFVLTGSLGWFFLRNPQSTGTLANRETTLPFEKWETVANQTRRKMPVQLPDGSFVLLEPNSSLRYIPGFTRALREVQLKGQGFFEVTKNPQRPFLVHTGGVTVRVVGTSFTVQALRPNEAVQVVVKTGRVEVFSVKKNQSRTPGVLLSPNQQVVVHPKDERLEPIRIDPSELKAYTPQVQQEMVFNEATLPEILRELETAYRIRINFDEQLLAECRLTTNLSDIPFFEKLKLICEAVGPNTRYEVLNGEVSVFSKGCNQ